VTFAEVKFVLPAKSCIIDGQLITAGNHGEPDFHRYLPWVQMAFVLMGFDQAAVEKYVRDLAQADGGGEDVDALLDGFQTDRAKFSAIGEFADVVLARLTIAGDAIVAKEQTAVFHVRRRVFHVRVSPPLCSTFAVYILTICSVRSPVIAMISCDVHPASASAVAAVCLSQWKWRLLRPSLSRWTRIVLRSASALIRCPVYVCEEKQAGERARGQVGVQQHVQGDDWALASRATLRFGPPLADHEALAIEAGTRHSEDVALTLRRPKGEDIGIPQPVPHLACLELVACLERPRLKAFRLVQSLDARCRVAWGLETGQVTSPPLTSSPAPAGFDSPNQDAPCDLRVQHAWRWCE
jgi:hypothetical protein